MSANRFGNATITERHYSRFFPPFVELLNFFEAGAAVAARSGSGAAEPGSSVGGGRRRSIVETGRGPGASHGGKSLRERRREVSGSFSKARRPRSNPA